MELSPTTRLRLDIQGFEGEPDSTLAPVARWLRLAFGLCASLAIVGLLFRFHPLLWTLTGVAALGALSPVHPFDLLYNHAIRYLTKTGPLPRRGVPSRFACGLGSVWMAATILLLGAGRTTLALVLGWTLVGVAVLVSTTDICIPSLTYRLFFGFPPRRSN
jgi:hypothetical protein